MSEQVATGSLVMVPPSPPPQDEMHSTPKITKKTLVQECENVALNSFKEYLLGGRERNPTHEKMFITAVKKSPSRRTIDFGIMLAVEAGWQKALDKLFSVDLSTYKPFKSEESCQHPLKHYALSLLDPPPASGSRGRGTYVNSALLYAIVSGKTDVVKVLARHISLNIEDVLSRPLLHYVYLLDQQDLRRMMLDIVIPKLKPSLENLCTAAEHGDLESTKYFAKNLRPKDLYFAGLAGVDAILGGHDAVAKWIVETSGLINWKVDLGSLINAAVSSKSLDMIEFLSARSPVLPLHQIGHGTASDLWAFLQQINHPELFKKFVPSHPEGYSLWGKSAK